MFIYDSFVCCLSRLCDACARPACLGRTSDHGAVHFPCSLHSHGFILSRLLLFFGSGGLDLTLNLLTVWCSNGQFTACAHFNFLVFSGVKDLKNVLAKVITGTILHGPALEKHLDISQLGEVEVALFVECVVLEAKLLDSGL